MKSHVYGPVPSRRLGRSLGVDLVPLKTCTYDCIYCQLPRTTCHTIERKEWVGLQEVLAELKEKLSSKPDYISLAGSGDPSLYSRIGELIAGIKEISDIPIAVLTNGSLLSFADFRNAILGADLVIPSLDAGDEQTFRQVNRPVEEISFDEMVKGLVDFRREYKGQYWLEVMLIAKITDTAEQVSKIAEIVQRINPDRIQLNTVTRPPNEQYALPVPRAELERLAKMLGPKAEVIADYQGAEHVDEFEAKGKDILQMLSRRPCTIEDISQSLGMNASQAVKYIQQLSERGLLETQTRQGGLYYFAKRHDGPSGEKT